MNKVGRLSGKATQFRGDKFDIVSPIYKLAASSFRATTKL